MIAAVTTLLAAVLGYYLWWRFSELARARGQKRKLHGRKILPSPCRLLPKWLGFFGGHTLLIDSEQVGRPCVERLEWLNWLSNTWFTFDEIARFPVVLLLSRCILLTFLRTVIVQRLGGWGVSQICPRFGRG